MGRPIRPSGAGDDSSGRTWGLSGNGVIYLAFSLIGCIWLTFFIRSTLKAPWAWACGIGILPFFLTLTYWLLFIEGKRKSYVRDCAEGLAGGDYWVAQPEIAPPTKLRTVFPEEDRG